MDIYEFINSKDVKEYCKSIGHVFNPIEMACMIDGSEKSIGEKNVLFRELIENYPDMQFHKSVDFPIKSGLHDYLEALLERNRIAVDFFYNPEKYEDRRYYYTLCSYDVGEFGLGPKIDPVKDAFKKHSVYKWFNSVDELFEDVLPYWNKAVNHRYIRVLLKTKRQECFRFYADYNKTREIIRFDDHSKINGVKHPGQLFRIFVDYPIPFKPGDIVCSIHEPETPYVLTALPKSVKGSSKNLSGMINPKLKTPGFATMGYFTSDGIFKLSWDKKYDMFGGWGIKPNDLEYYRGAHDEKYNKLLAVSEYVKKRVEDK